MSQSELKDRDMSKDARDLLSGLEDLRIDEELS